MTSNDVRSILSLPLATPSTSTASRRSLNTFKRPDGISRELYALIGDNAPSLAEAQASVKFRDRPKLKTKKVNWEWTSFAPAGRKDQPVVLSHWVRVTDDDPQASVAYFSKFNDHGPSVIDYSQFEYDEQLTDPDWTPHETTYLFDLLRTYDLRFVIAADRYAYTGLKGEEPPRQRSVEDIKDRYYSICRRLVRTRTATDPQAQQQLVHAYSFDKAREVKRKQYASELFHLTAAEIAEEEALFIEVKRMEQNDRRYRSDRDDLMRTVMGLDSGLVNLDQANAEGVLGLDKNKKRKRLEEAEAQSPPAPLTKKQKDSAAFDAAHCLYRVPHPPATPNTSHLAAKHPVHAPVCLRSTRLPLPKPSAAIRITELLNELGISTQKLVMPTRANVEILDRLLVAAGGLVDMKRQVDRVEQEVRTLKAQKDGFVPPAARPKTRSASIVSTDTSGTNRRSRH